jgi:hypothetical protein
MGRPSTYSQETADAICERLTNGESLRRICSDEEMPHIATALRWVGENDAFREQYARAREIQAEVMADDLLGIADNEGADVQRDRLRVDARKWVMSKLAPKKYGDKIQQEHSGPDGAPLMVPNLNVTIGQPGPVPAPEAGAGTPDAS